MSHRRSKSDVRKKKTSREKGLKRNEKVRSQRVKKNLKSVSGGSTLADKKEVSKK